MSIEAWKEIHPYITYLIQDDMENKKSTNAQAVADLLKLFPSM